MNILNKTNSLRMLTTLSLLVMLVLPLSAQESGDSLFTFHFQSGKNEFYSSVKNNATELARLYNRVDLSKDLISGGRILVFVDGYSSSLGSDAYNLALARIRSRRVKSELITNKGLIEDNFVTHNHAGQGDFVTVHLLQNFNRYKAETRVSEPEAEQPELQYSTVVVSPQAPAPVYPSSEPEIEVTTVVTEPFVTDSVEVIVQQPELVDSLHNLTPIKSAGHFALKINALACGLLMPNLEFEWHFAPRFSVGLEGQMPWYSRDAKRQVYRLATVSPEIRYHFHSRQMWQGMYVGAFGGLGLYQLQNGGDGYHGEGVMAGLSFGYMWTLSRHFFLEAGIGAGYMSTRYKVYENRDGHKLYMRTKTLNYFGPLKLKVSIAWKFDITTKTVKSTNL